MNDWMPPLPEPDVIVHYTADQMRQAQADAARAALEQAIEACHEATRLKWERMVKTLTEGGLLEPFGPKDCADAIRALAKEIT